MKLPIFIDENGDIRVYSSIDAASKSLEPIDVHNGEYTAYDAMGRLLQLVATDTDVIILLSEDELNHAMELKEKLKHFLEVIGKTREVHENPDLPYLVEVFKKFAE